MGLDGSLVFLEHVFWVISLNTLLVIIFAFIPYHMGTFVISQLNMKYLETSTHLDGLVITLLGYIVIGALLVLLHSVASLARFKKTERILGLCYLVVKVSLLAVIEIGVFPLVCGWWLDICSLVRIPRILSKESFYANALVLNISADVGRHSKGSRIKL